MNKIVYAVSSGTYSDYSINAVFSTEEAANAYADRHNRADPFGGDFRVEEWEVDAVTVKDKTDHIAFMVELTHPPFLSSDVWRANGNADHDTLPFEDVRKGSFERHYPSHSTHTTWTAWVWALDRNAALKIGADRIMQEVAKDAGISVSDINLPSTE